MKKFFVRQFKEVARSDMTLEIGLYTITAIFNRALPFLLLPILTRYLDPLEYGHLTLFNMYLAFGLILVGGSASTQLKNKFYRQSQTDSAQLTFNIAILQTSFTLLLLLVISVFPRSFETSSDLPLVWLLVIPVLSLSISIGNLGMVLLRCQRRAFVFGIAQIVTTVTNLALSLIFIIVLHMGWEGRALGIVIASFIFAGGGIVYLAISGYLRISLNWHVMKSIFSLTASLLPSALFVQVIDQSGKLFVNNFQSTAELGVYNIGILVGMIVYFLSLSSLHAIEPWTYRQIADGSSLAARSIAKVLCGYFIAVSTCALLVSFFSELIVYIMAGSKYQKAQIIVPWIAFGYAGWAGYSSLKPILISKNRHKIIPLISATGAILSLLLGYLLIGINGTIGAAQAFTFTYIFMWVFSVVYTLKVVRSGTS